MSNTGLTFTHCREGHKYQVGRGNGSEGIVALRDSPKIVQRDIQACNGVIHALENVMLPSWWETV